jgi:hypothetical protein
MKFFKFLWFCVLFGQFLAFFYFLKILEIFKIPLPDALQTGLSQTLSEILCLWRMLSVPVSGSALSGPVWQGSEMSSMRSTCTADNTWVRHGPAMTSPDEAVWRRNRGRQRLREIEAESGRDRMLHSRLLHASLEEFFEFFFNIFKEFCFCALFRQFLAFLIFRKFWKFSNLFQWSSQEMHASLGACHIIFLADSTSVSPSCCLPRCVDQPASAGRLSLHVPVCLTCCVPHLGFSETTR